MLEIPVSYSAMVNIFRTPLRAALTEQSKAFPEKSCMARFANFSEETKIVLFQNKAKHSQAFW